MSRTLPLPLPPSGISVWRPLSSSEGSLVAIIGSGPSGATQSSEEDVQCVWCGLRSTPAPACDVCGSPLYDSIAIWQPAPPPSAVEIPPDPTVSQPTVTATAVTPRRERPKAVSFWPDVAATAPTDPFAEAEPVEAIAPEPGPAVEAAAPEPVPATDSPFKAFKRFAGLEIHWIRRADR